MLYVPFSSKGTKLSRRSIGQAGQAIMLNKPLSTHSRISMTRWLASSCFFAMVFIFGHRRRERKRAGCAAQPSTPADGGIDHSIRSSLPGHRTEGLNRSNTAAASLACPFFFCGDDCKPLPKLQLLALPPQWQHLWLLAAPSMLCDVSEQYLRYPHITYEYDSVSDYLILHQSPRPG